MANAWHSSSRSCKLWRSKSLDGTRPYLIKGNAGVSVKRKVSLTRTVISRRAKAHCRDKKIVELGKRWKQRNTFQYETKQYEHQD